MVLMCSKKGPQKKFGKAIDSFITSVDEPRTNARRERSGDDTTWGKVDLRCCPVVEEDPHSGDVACRNEIFGAN
jgi:hypothetical protein